MPSDFDARAARAGAAVDRRFGEQFEYRPYAAADPNARPAPDATRSVRTITGIYSGPSARGGSGPARRGHVLADNAAHASARPSVEFDLAQLPYRPASGDRLARLDGGAIFHVAEVRPDGMGRAILDLNAV